jgi:L-amino acid N-acyltransferase YncA
MPHAPPVPREAVAADLPAIVAIYNSTIPGRRATTDLEPVTIDVRREWFARHTPERRPLWVTEEGGAVAAWLSMDDFKERAAYSVTAETAVYVHEDHRGQGHGRALCEHAIAAAPRLGVTRMLAVVFADNESSVALFCSLGFRCWGSLPGVTVVDGIERDIAILGLRVPTQGARR